MASTTVPRGRTRVSVVPERFEDVEESEPVFAQFVEFRRVPAAKIYALQ